MTQPAFPAAHAAAAQIRAHFERHIPTKPRRNGKRVAVAPDPAAIEAIIEAAFWASLRREEGYVPRISLAFVEADAVKWPLKFEQPLTLAAQPLARLAPAVERPGIHLGVWRDGESFSVWGTTRYLPPYCFVLEVIAPGLLVVKHSREESEKFVNIAAFHGNEVKFIDERFGRQPDCPDLLNSLLGFDIESADNKSASVLIHLASSMRAHGRGGSLLVVPEGNQEWRKSVSQPALYSLLPPFTELAELIQGRGDGNPGRRWLDALRRSVDVVASLTAVDGATVIDDRYQALAFGAKIVRRRRSQPVSRLLLTEPIEGARAKVVQPSELGGTRHLSAAQFIHDQRDALALIASQDGRFTVFVWSAAENLVRAHRIETLLL